MTNDNAVAAIRARVEAIHGFEHVHKTGALSGRNAIAELDENGKWWLWDSNVPYSIKACEFIAHAPDDIRTLLALLTERDRELAAAREQKTEAVSALRELVAWVGSDMYYVFSDTHERIANVLRQAAEHAARQPDGGEA